MLTAAGMRLDPVPPADHPQQLIIRRPRVPVPVPGRGFCAGLVRVGSAAAGSRTGAVIRAAAYRGH